MTDVRYPCEGRCREEVWLRDCYRRTGRGPTGFTMHYKRQQCGRKVKNGETHCWQHRRAG